MGQALYRKYRSMNLDQIIGQDHITKSLSEAINSGRISHAYLFTGPRGVGKTSIARILAYQINGLDYNDESNDIDIIEIDAASNRRIDEIRDIRDKVYIAPTSSKYKVYIIDEAHMLTREAFNALLKTLEEPPEHAVFILATTEAHKLPQTIVSRTQRYNFRPISTDLVQEHLAEIAAKEKFEVDIDALQLLAKHGDGSFRDSISLLDQASNRTQRLTIEAVQDMLGVPPGETIDFLAKAATGAISKADVAKTVRQSVLDGYQPEIIAKLLIEKFILMIINSDNQEESNKISSLVAELIEVPTSSDPGMKLELCLLASASTLPSQGKFESSNISKDDSLVHAEYQEESIVGTPEAEIQPEASTQEVEKQDLPESSESEEIKQSETAPKTKHEPKGDLNLDQWAEVLLGLKQKYNTLYSVARMAEPSILEPNTLRLSVAFAFHQKRLNENSNKQRISDIFEKVTGNDVLVDIVLDKSAKPAAQPIIAKPAPAKSDMTAISNIFGGGELIES